MVSLYLPPRGMEFFGCRQGEGVSLPTTEGAGSRKPPTPQAGWAVVGDCGRIIGAKRKLYERNVGGLNNLVLAQEEQKDESSNYQNRQKDDDGNDCSVHRRSHSDCIGRHIGVAIGLILD